MAPKVLVVEDDEHIRTIEKIAFEAEGFSVKEVDSAEAAMKYLEKRTVDIAVVDINLPEMDGLKLCVKMRETGNFPVIMVTARNSADDVVAGLDAGADDYVGKPFRVRELMARVKSHIRKTTGAIPEKDISFNRLSISLNECEAKLDSEVLLLTKTEFKLLSELAKQPNVAFTREQLLESVWGYSFFGDTRLVDTHIKRLRFKLEDQPNSPKIVLTVRGVGYKLDRATA
jgi:DNA-binding response OmpR family regulator